MKLIGRSKFHTGLLIQQPLDIRSLAFSVKCIGMFLKSVHCLLLITEKPEKRKNIWCQNIPLKTTHRYHVRYSFEGIKNWNAGNRYSSFPLIHDCLGSMMYGKKKENVSSIISQTRRKFSLNYDKEGNFLSMRVFHSTTNPNSHNTWLLQWKSWVWTFPQATWILPSPTEFTQDPRAAMLHCTV